MRRIIGTWASSCLRVGLAAGLCLAIGSMVLGQSSPGGGAGHHGGQAGNESHSPASYYHGAKPTAPVAFSTVHGGKYLVTRSAEYELVIMPLADADLRLRRDAHAD